MQIREEKEHSVELVLSANEAEHIAQNIQDNAKLAGTAAVALADFLQQEGFSGDKLPKESLRHEWKNPDDMSLS
ncbi:hypothetical protein [Acidithiobacillus sulfurivorans]|uniref:Uncharacterized protein n=1 Tax=Acidithiobacillus sulfurivorans TaxID=1958756 RepID=A0ABS5ZWN9_9PROT|nr:hypothetical protein [Acidithiobacillus sulfurivorans]MBU2759638.1 hypothetical protein [Acidithiobacillus sulfurivorans]